MRLVYSLVAALMLLSTPSAVAQTPYPDRPIKMKVSDNVDATHDLHVKTFAHKGHIYIGVHMLCPNPGLK